MPFDSTTWDKALVEDLNLDKPSIQALSHILRNRDLWPKGFEWNYEQCRTCAMGLAAKLWSEHIQLVHGWEVRRNTDIVRKAISLPCVPAIVIFAELFQHLGDDISAIDVTPENVADWLDAWLDGTFPLCEPES